MNNLTWLFKNNQQFRRNAIAFGAGYSFDDTTTWLLADAKETEEENPLEKIDFTDDSFEKLQSDIKNEAYLDEVHGWCIRRQLSLATVKDWLQRTKLLTELAIGAEQEDDSTRNFYWVKGYARIQEMYTRIKEDYEKADTERKELQQLIADLEMPEGLFEAMHTLEKLLDKQTGTVAALESILPKYRELQHERYELQTKLRKHRKLIQDMHTEVHSSFNIDAIEHRMKELGIEES